MSDLRGIPHREKDKMLDEHQVWVESGGKEGRQADFRNTYLNKVEWDGVNLSGALLWDASFEEGSLVGANLSGAGLGRAKLYGTDLYKADLTFADLVKTHLSGPNLREANLSEAALCSANLYHADLGGANLSHAKLDGANFTKAILDGTDFTDCWCGNTIFGDCDLSGARNLETIRHGSPSTVGLDTLVKSNGAIPKSFLLGCGVPERLIDGALGAFREAGEFRRKKCLIYYAAEDKPFVRRLYDKLLLAGVSVWLAERRRHPDKALHLYSHLDDADKFILLFSPSSVQNKWHWMEDDIKEVHKREKMIGEEAIFPVSLVPFDEIKESGVLAAGDGRDWEGLIREYFVPNPDDEAAIEAVFQKLIARLR